MRQFDVVKNPDPDAARFSPLLVILQHDHVEAMPTVIVAPLVKPQTFDGSSRLHLDIVFDGVDYVLSLTDLTSVLKSMLTDKPLGNLSDRRDDIVRGLDLLFIGF